MGAALYLPAWMEDTELTIHSKPAFLLWLLYRGAGCNVTPVAKRIIYFQDRTPVSYSRHAIKPERQTPRAVPHKLVSIEATQAPLYKFHSLSYSDRPNQVLSDWRVNPEPITVNYAREIVPRAPRQPVTSQYGEICYTHVVPRTTPPHTLPLTAQDMAGRHCPGLDAPYETVSAPRTVSMTTADGRQRPMVETQIYSVYPVGAAPSPFQLQSARSTATQTERRELVNTEESLPVIDNVVADECASHYWNAPDAYPDLPDFPVTSQHGAKRPPNAVYVYTQASQDAGSAFRSAAHRADASQGMTDAGYAPLFQMPMIYFYHY